MDCYTHGYLCCVSIFLLESCFMLTRKMAWTGHPNAEIFARKNNILAAAQSSQPYLI